MKALDEYFLMVVSTLLLNKVYVFANFMLNFESETWQWKGQCIANINRHGIYGDVYLYQERNLR